MIGHKTQNKLFRIAGKMMLDLEKCVTELENWDEGKGIVLAGVGGTFCSGGDLDTVQRLLQGTDGSSMAAFMHNVTSRLHNIPMISVAAINGHALGGGAELTTACDFRIMTENSKIGFVQIKLKIAPGWGGCTRLVNLLGRAKALQLLTSGKVMDSQYAESIDYVSEVVSDDSDIAEQGTKWLAENCNGDAKAIGVIKTMVTAATELNRRESLDRERQLFSMIWGSDSHFNALNQNLKHK